MEVTTTTWIIALSGLVLMGLLMTLQMVAVVRPRAAWTIENVYGGAPDHTDPKAYFAFNQGFAWADAVFWGPLQIIACVGMLLGQQWGFLLGLAASVPFWYTAITIYIWDRELGFRKDSWTYWVFIWGMFPVFGVIQGVYCFVRLLGEG
jgi:formate-dependent nitrite reductase membrane component NrfD